MVISFYFLWFVSVCPSAPDSSFAFGLCWRHCLHFGSPETWGFSLSFDGFTLSGSPTLLSRVSCCQVQSLQGVRFVASCVYDVRERWLPMSSWSASAERRALPTNLRYRHWTAHQGVFPWLSLRPSSVFVRQFWDGFLRAENLSIASGAYSGLRKWRYQDLTRFSTEVKFFFLVRIQLTRLLGVGGLYIRDRGIWKQQQIYGWGWW